MLYRRGNQWELYPHRVRYIQHGEEIEQWALPNKEWWINFADKWEHTQIIEFIDLELSEEQLARFEEIKNMPEDFIDVYIEYILNGTFPEEFPNTHPLMLVKLLKENEQFKVENTLLKSQNQANADVLEFHEEVLAEIILTIVP